MHIIHDIKIQAFTRMGYHSYKVCWGGSRGGSGGSVEPPKPVDYDAVVQKLAEQQPRRMLLADPIFEES